MTNNPLTEPGTERSPGRAVRAAYRPIDAVVWVGTAVLVAAAACTVGLSAGRLLPVRVGWEVDDRPVELARMMAVLGGAYGLLAGAAAGLLRGRPNRIAAGLKGGLGFAVMGAFAGASGPLLTAATGGRVPTGAASALACAVTGGFAALIGYTLRRPAREPLSRADDDWAADPSLAAQPASAADRTVVRQWPILMVSGACLVVAIVAPPSPAAWPMIGIALLGFAVAWVLAGQEHRLRELERRLRHQEAGEPGAVPDHRAEG